MTAVSDDRREARVRWHCRRGLLELDVLLARFLERDYPQLTADEHTALDRLLELPDNELLDGCFGIVTLDDPALQALVQKIAR
ncbi:MAG: succinate dehydrogenase assembly factor 2 [Gammaproteobacteria bacterium]|nr:succinate dehydrogenase assembly factor 2 [Gammaproteobacteria bacterium]